MNVDVKTLPPGVTCASAYKYYDSAGDEEAWLEFPQIRYYTNAFIVKDDQVGAIVARCFDRGED